MNLSERISYEYILLNHAWLINEWSSFVGKMSFIPKKEKKKKKGSLPLYNYNTWINYM